MKFVYVLLLCLVVVSSLSSFVFANAAVIASTSAAREREEASEARLFCSPPYDFASLNNCSLSYAHDRTIKDYVCVNKEKTFYVESFCDGKVFKATYSLNSNNTLNFILHMLVLLIIIFSILFIYLKGEKVISNKED